ncbi:hypothetical protein niasHT_009182 [Heterodera trifolii]|uniref:RING-type domain-containing protein n=1 Tax=Heterodera trifolii TaxID=157864 RepID=A0ABD2MED6_9BILA
MNSDIGSQMKDLGGKYRFLRYLFSDLKNLALNCTSRIELLENWANNERYSPYTSNRTTVVSPAMLRETFELLNQQEKQHEAIANRVLRPGNEEVATIAVTSLKRAMASSSSSSAATSAKKPKLVSEDDREVAALALAAFTQIKMRLAEDIEGLEMRTRKLEEGAAATMEAQMETMRQQMEQKLRQNLLEAEQRIDHKWATMLSKEQQRTQRIAAQSAAVIGQLMSKRLAEGGEEKENEEKKMIISDRCNWCLEKGQVLFGVRGCGHVFSCPACTIAIMAVDEPKCLICFQKVTDLEYLGS